MTRLFFLATLALSACSTSPRIQDVDASDIYYSKKRIELKKHETPISLIMLNQVSLELVNGKLIGSKKNAATSLASKSHYDVMRIKPGRHVFSVKYFDTNFTDKGNKTIKKTTYSSRPIQITGVVEPWSVYVISSKGVSSFSFKKASGPLLYKKTMNETLPSFYYENSKAPNDAYPFLDFMKMKYALLEGDLELVRSLLKRNRGFAKVRYSNFPWMWWAVDAKKNGLKITRELLKAGIPIDMKVGGGGNLVLVAARGKSSEVIEIIKELIGAGVDPEEKDKWGNNALEWALSGCSLETAKFLFGKGVRIESSRKQALEKKLQRKKDSHCLKWVQKNI